jgi:hypothetical protein
LFEKVERVARGAYEKAVATVVHRGRGRPRKDGQPKASDVVDTLPSEISGDLPADDPAPAPTGAAPGLQAVSEDTLRRCCRTFHKTLFSAPAVFLHSQAVARKGPADAAEILGRCVPTDAELDDLAEYGAILLKKWNVDTKYAPEAVYGMTLAGVGARFALAFADVRKTPAPVPGPAPKPQPPKP